MALPKVQILRTASPGQKPAELAPGEFAIEMASTPPRLWIGVDKEIDGSGMKMLLPAGGVIVSDYIPVATVQGALWYESDTGVLWMWYEDGTSGQWVQINGLGGGGTGGGTGGASVTVSPEPPDAPLSGDMWWESDGGVLWISYQDADSQQWVQASGPSAGANMRGPQGVAGPQGLIGPPGPEGPASTVAGPVGPAGPAGPAGTAGPQGIQGPAGPAGAASSVPGPQGPQGPQGPAGPQGPGGVSDARLAYAGDRNDVSGNMTEPWPGSVVSAITCLRYPSDLRVGGVNARHRYMQINLWGGWYTIGYV